MPDNPYQAPESVVDTVAQLSEYEEEKLNRLALGQKLVIYAVLLYFIAVGLRLIIPFLTSILVVVCLVMSLVGLFKIVKVIEIHMIFKILYFVMLFIPLINLLALLSLNSRATKMLRSYGYTVGFMGAKKPAA